MSNPSESGSIKHMPCTNEPACTTKMTTQDVWWWDEAKSMVPFDVSLSLPANSVNQQTCREGGSVTAT